jgi:hypothetical protein
MIAVKDKTVGALPAEMDNALWPYKHTETTTVFDREPSRKSLAYADNDEPAPWEGQEDSGETEATEANDATEMSDQEELSAAVLKKLVNGFTEEETAFGDQAVREQHWKHDFSPFSNGGNMNNGALGVEK